MNNVPVPALARAAFADGWARSNGPLTGRVKTGCTVAVQLAAEHAHEPNILETTLLLGSLEGTWAKVYARREQLAHKHLTAITSAYRTLTTELDIKDAVNRFRAGVRTAEGDRPQRIRVAAQAAANQLTSQLLTDPSAPHYKTAVAAVADGLLDAQAEGTAGAIAVAALQHGLTRINFDLAFTDARQALDPADAREQAVAWLRSVVAGNTSDLADAWVRAAETGTTKVKEADDDGNGDDSLDDDIGDDAALVAAAGAVLGGDHIRAVDTLMSQALGQAFTAGVMLFLTRQGARTVDFITAGVHPCPRCLDIESNNPWPLTSVPSPPVHPNCACVVSSTDPLPALDVSSYLVGV